MGQAPITIESKKIPESDIVIIAVIGPIGAGKSYFIDILAEQPGRRSSNGVVPYTRQIEAVLIKHPQRTDSIILLDTPGFEDSISEKDALNKIKEWLSKTYLGKNVKLSGILYLHRITDNRCGENSPFIHFDKFNELCGEPATERVGLVTTMWDSVEGDIEEYERREEQLRTEYWKRMEENGSSICRFHPKSLSTAQSILVPFINKKGMTKTKKALEGRSSSDAQGSTRDGGSSTLIQASGDESISKSKKRSKVKHDGSSEKGETSDGHSSCCVGCFGFK